MSGWGLSHLSDMPETVTFGGVLLLAIVVLIVLRFFFADVTVGVKGGVK